MSCGVGRRCGSDPTLLWLWSRPAAAAPIQPVAWELPYAWVWPKKGLVINRDSAYYAVHINIYQELFIIKIFFGVPIVT